MSILSVFKGSKEERIVETHEGLELISEDEVRQSRAETAEVELKEIEADFDRQVEVATGNELLRLMKIEANIAATKPKLIKARDMARANLNRKYGKGEVESRVDLSEIGNGFTSPWGKVAMAFLIPAVMFFALTKLTPAEAEEVTLNPLPQAQEREVPKEPRQ